jgi:hypothetical protein
MQNPSRKLPPGCRDQAAVPPLVTEDAAVAVSSSLSPLHHPFPLALAQLPDMNLLSSYLQITEPTPNGSRCRQTEFRRGITRAPQGLDPEDLATKVASTY